MKNINLILILIILIILIFPLNLILGMESSNYEIKKDSLNFGGIDNGQSSSYSLKDTIGEVGTGESESTNYKIGAGYRQLTVDPTLDFDVTDTTIALGTLSTTAVSSDTATMTVGTNAASGYSVTVNGATLDTGSATITALATATTSSVGSEQFGLNLKSNATPNIGSEASGGSGTASAGYGTADSYKFVTGDTVASASGTSNTTTFTMSYIANIASNTDAGSYTATHTYIATGNF